MYYDEDTVTDQPMRQICAEMIREKALRLLADEIPHGIAVTIEKMTERDDGLFDIEANIVCERDSHKQIIIGRLRVNLDGNTPFRIKEVKTYQWEKGWKKTPPKYINQVQVQMFASGIHEADIVAYGLEPEDYKNYLRDLDPRRLQEIPVKYDPNWIESVYLPKLRILADCLKRGVFPNV